MTNLVQNVAIGGAVAFVGWAANQLFGERTMFILIGCVVVIAYSYQIDRLKERIEALESDLQALTNRH